MPQPVPLACEQGHPRPLPAKPNPAHAPRHQTEELKLDNTRASGIRQAVLAAYLILSRISEVLLQTAVRFLGG